MTSDPKQNHPAEHQTKGITMPDAFDALRTRDLFLLRKPRSNENLAPRTTFDPIQEAQNDYEGYLADANSQGVNLESGNFQNHSLTAFHELSTSWNIPQPTWDNSITSDESAQLRTLSTHIDLHVFSVAKGSRSRKYPRGRRRSLTAQEKGEALEIRKVKACWTCHLSKIKVLLGQISFIARICLPSIIVLPQRSWFSMSTM